MKIRTLLKRTLALSLLAITLAIGPSADADPFHGKVLVVLSGVDFVAVKDAPAHPTGFFLSELMGPVRDLIRAGYEVVVANPNGKPAAMDVVSDDPKWFKNAEDYADAKAALARLDGIQHPRPMSSLSRSDLAGFDGVFLPGGHAPMEDLYRDAQLGRILKYFHAHAKPTGLICHAPIALLSARSANQPWIYRGYDMTAFSTAEEKQEEARGVFGGNLTFYVENALRDAGGKVAVGSPWSSHAVRDRELITGQNPMSEGEFSQLLLEELTDSKLKEKLQDVMPQGSRWSDGYQTIFIGRKKASVSSDEFESLLREHIREVKEAFLGRGLKGYAFAVIGDTEVAYQNWESEQAMQAAFATKEGAAIAAGAGKFMDLLLFKKRAPHAADCKSLLSKTLDQ